MKSINTRKPLVLSSLTMVVLLLAVMFAFSGQSKPAPVFAAKAAADLDQIRNGSADSPISPANWVNGNAGPSNAHFIEGNSISYRVVMTDLPTDGTTVHLFLGYDITHSGAHAIDYLTHYERLDVPFGHDPVFGHAAENVDPTIGTPYTESVGADTEPITAPANSSSVPTQPGASFAAQSPAPVMTMWGGDLTGFSYHSEGDQSATKSETVVKVSFIPDQATAVLAWGGHIARGDQWDPEGSASDVNGSPYHMRLKDWNIGNLGNQDRSLKASAVVVPPTLKLTKNVINNFGTPASADAFGLHVDLQDTSVTNYNSGDTKVLPVGTHTADEVGGVAGYSRGDWTGDCDSATGSVTLAFGDAKECTITNTAIAPTLEVIKILDPTDDGGTFNLLIDGQVEEADAGHNETTGAVDVNVGQHTVSETAFTGTNLGDYVAVIGGDCLPNGTLISPIQLAQQRICTITNHRKPELRLIKATVPTTDLGKFDLSDSVEGLKVDDGQNGADSQFFNTTIGAHTVSEAAGTGTSLGDYASSISCDNGDSAGIQATQLVLTPLVYGDQVTCTFTNRRLPQLTLNKIVINAYGTPASVDSFGLHADDADGGSLVQAFAQSGDTHNMPVGTSFAQEVAQAGYARQPWTGDCDPNTGAVALTFGDNKECTITNIAIAPTLKVIKHLDPTGDGGLFDLRIDGTTHKFDASHNDDTGFIAVNEGQHTVSELAGTGTNLSSYVSVIGGDCNTDGTLISPIGLNETRTCTILNTRLPMCETGHRVVSVTLEYKSGAAVATMQGFDGNGNQKFAGSHSLGVDAAGAIFGPFVPHAGTYFHSQNMRFKINGTKVGDTVHLSCSDDPELGDLYSIGGRTFELVGLATLEFVK